QIHSFRRIKNIDSAIPPANHQTSPIKRNERRNTVFHHTSESFRLQKRRKIAPDAHFYTNINKNRKHSQYQLRRTEKPETLSRFGYDIFRLFGVFYFGKHQKKCNEKKSRTENNKWKFHIFHIQFSLLAAGSEKHNSK